MYMQVDAKELIHIYTPKKKKQTNPHIHQRLIHVSWLLQIFKTQSRSLRDVSLV